MAEKLRVLVVDDLASIRDVAAGILGDEGYFVQVAASGEDALEIMCGEGAGSFDFIVTDLEMDGMNGVEFANQIVIRFKMAPKIILMTASGITEEKAGANILRIFRKPFSMSTLAQFMQNV